MKKNRLVFYSFILLFLAQTSLAQEGKKIPAVTLSNLKGEKVDVSKLHASGRIIVIDFWATWCIPCKKELNNMAELYDDWKKNYNVEIVAISIDDSKSSAKVKTTVDGLGWDYTILLDPNQELKRALNFQNIPYTLLLDKEGNIVYLHDGYVDGDEFILEEKIKSLAGK